ncbi:MAG: cupin domain-containing protein [Gammaproteobacteria bacterium]|nr:cupin domain-containing protein [Gammaproteobacteria bacterium]
MHFFDWNKIDFKLVRKGVWYKTIRGKNMQLFYIKLEPGQFTDHNHPHEQMGYVLGGEIELTIGPEKKICKAGEAYYIPSNIQHGFKTLGNKCAEYIDIFSPTKEEHSKL